MRVLHHHQVNASMINIINDQYAGAFTFKEWDGPTSVSSTHSVWCQGVPSHPNSSNLVLEELLDNLGSTDACLPVSKYYD